ncbi:MAG: hypothetical protein B9S33_18260 [Pedosphaera sp. Tous-C6FEB]|nr:MAG: hypothetical protein B9S33_18260 [Pedosphaera sp. Tous-C6FEB]
MVGTPARIIGCYGANRAGNHPLKCIGLLILWPLPKLFANEPYRDLLKGYSEFRATWIELTCEPRA